MNPRERNLAILLGLVLVIGVGSYFGIRLWWVPLRDANAAIDQLKIDNEEIERKVQAFNKDRAKLTLARMKSLPTDREQAKAEYIAYLNKLLRDSGFGDKVAIRPSNVPKTKLAGVYANVKEAGLEVVSFRVTNMKGTLGQLVDLLEQMQRTPYEHRIVSLTIDRDPSTAKDASKELAVVMVVETLLVAKAGLEPQFMIYDFIAGRAGTGPLGLEALATAVMLERSIPLPPERDYAMIADRNIFVGAIPLPPLAEKKKKEAKKIETVKEEKDPPKIEPDIDMPRHVYVTHTDPVKQEAYLRYRLLNIPEQHRYANKKDLDEFEIWDESKKYQFFKAKLLKVDLHKIYFQVENKVFTLETGRPFSQAEEYTADVGWGEWMFLSEEGLYDRQFELNETRNDKKVKKDNKGNPTKTKGQPPRR